jgi:hypothetical protein
MASFLADLLADVLADVLADILAEAPRPPILQSAILSGPSDTGGGRDTVGFAARSDG